MEKDISELFERVRSLEKEVQSLGKAMAEQDKYDVLLKGKIDLLANEVRTVRLDVVSVVQEHNKKMWNLVMTLLLIVCLFGGLKLGPEIIKALTQ